MFFGSLFYLCEGTTQAEMQAFLFATACEPIKSVKRVRYGLYEKRSFI